MDPGELEGMEKDPEGGAEEGGMEGEGGGEGAAGGVALTPGGESVDTMEKGALSPLTGSYLLIVLAEPHSEEDREIIIKRLTKGLRSWDLDSTHVDLSCELLNLANAAPESDEARNGEKLVQWASENLVVEVLIHCQVNTLQQCMKNLLSSFTKHRHIIHAGYTFQGSGSWILQDGTFSFADFVELWEEPEVHRILGAYKGDISVSLHCAEENGWKEESLRSESFTKLCQVSCNPEERLVGHSSGIISFVEYISKMTQPAPLKEILEPSEIVGNIRFSHPTLYVFPGGQGDAALFGVNGFNMLIDGGFARRSCFWDFTRHLDRLDAVLLTRVNNNSICGLDSVLDRKRINQVYPQIGHFFGNVMERKHPPLEKSTEGADGDLLVSLTETGQRMLENLKNINLRPQHCFREHTIEPINLYHKVGHGKLDMYVLNPARDSREVREFLSKWNTDCKSFVQAKMNVKVDGKETNYPVLNLVSICALLVWQPDNAREPITRILFPGSTPQQKIFEALGKLKHLEFLKYPICSAKTIAASHKSRSKSERVVHEVRSQLKTGEEVKGQRAPSESRVASSRYAQTHYGQVRAKVSSSVRSDSSSTIQTTTDSKEEIKQDNKEKSRERSREKRRIIQTTTKDNKVTEKEEVKKSASSRRIDTGLSKTSSRSTSAKPIKTPTAKIDTGGKKSGTTSGVTSPPTGTNTPPSRTSRSTAQASSKYGIGVTKTTVSKTSASSTSTVPATPPKSAKEATNRKVVTTTNRKSLIDRPSTVKSSSATTVSAKPPTGTGATKSSSKSTIPPRTSASSNRKSSTNGNSNEPSAVKRPGTAKSNAAKAAAVGAVGVGIAAGVAALAVSASSDKDSIEESVSGGIEESMDKDSLEDAPHQNGKESVPPTESSSELSSLEHVDIHDIHDDVSAEIERNGHSHEEISSTGDDTVVTKEDIHSETHTITEPGGDVGYDEEDEYLIVEKDESAGGDEDIQIHQEDQRREEQQEEIQIVTNGKGSKMDENERAEKEVEEEKEVVEGEEGAESEGEIPEPEMSRKTAEEQEVVEEVVEKGVKEETLTSPRVEKEEEKDAEEEDAKNEQIQETPEDSHPDLEEKEISKDEEGEGQRSPPPSPAQDGEDKEDVVDHVEIKTTESTTEEKVKASGEWEEKEICEGISEPLVETEKEKQGENAGEEDDDQNAKKDENEVEETLIEALQDEKILEEIAHDQGQQINSESQGAPEDKAVSPAPSDVGDDKQSVKSSKSVEDLDKTSVKSLSPAPPAEEKESKSPLVEDDKPEDKLSVKSRLPAPSIEDKHSVKSDQQDDEIDKHSLKSSSPLPQDKVEMEDDKHSVKSSSPVQDDDKHSVKSGASPVPPVEEMVKSEVVGVLSKTPEPHLDDDKMSIRSISPVPSVEADVLRVADTSTTPEPSDERLSALHEDHDHLDIATIEEEDDKHSIKSSASPAPAEEERSKSKSPEVGDNLERKLSIKSSVSPAPSEGDKGTKSASPVLAEDDKISAKSASPVQSQDDKTTPEPTGEKSIKSIKSMSPAPLEDKHESPEPHEDKSASPAPGDKSTSPTPGDKSASPAPGDKSVSPRPGDKSVSPAPPGDKPGPEPSEDRVSIKSLSPAPQVDENLEEKSSVKSASSPLPQDEDLAEKTPKSVTSLSPAPPADDKADAKESSKSPEATAEESKPSLDDTAGAKTPEVTEDKSSVKSSSSPAPEEISEVAKSPSPCPAEPEIEKESVAKNQSTPEVVDNKTASPEPILKSVSPDPSQDRPEDDDKHSNKSASPQPPANDDDKHSLKSASSPTPQATDDDKHSVKSTTPEPTDDKHSIKSSASPQPTVEDDDKHSIKSTSSPIPPAMDDDDKQSVKSASSPIPPADDKPQEISKSPEPVDDKLSTKSASPQPPKDEDKHSLESSPIPPATDDDKHSIKSASSPVPPVEIDDDKHSVKSASPQPPKDDDKNSIKSSSPQPPADDEDKHSIKSSSSPVPPAEIDDDKHSVKSASPQPPKDDDDKHSLKSSSPLPPNDDKPSSSPVPDDKHSIKSASPQPPVDTDDDKHSIKSSSPIPDDKRGGLVSKSPEPCGDDHEQENSPKCGSPMLLTDENLEVLKPLESTEDNKTASVIHDDDDKASVKSASPLPEDKPEQEDVEESKTPKTSSPVPPPESADDKTALEKSISPPPKESVEEVPESKEKVDRVNLAQETPKQSGVEVTTEKEEIETESKLTQQMVQSLQASVFMVPAAAASIFMPSSTQSPPIDTTADTNHAQVDEKEEKETENEVPDTKDTETEVKSQGNKDLSISQMEDSSAREFMSPGDSIRTDELDLALEEHRRRLSNAAVSASDIGNLLEDKVQDIETSRESQFGSANDEDDQRTEDEGEEGDKELHFKTGEENLLDGEEAQTPVCPQNLNLDDQNQKPEERKKTPEEIVAAEVLENVRIMTSGQGKPPPVQIPSAIPSKIPRDREVIRTPDEVADLPMHEEVEPGTYETDEFLQTKITRTKKTDEKDSTAAQPDDDKQDENDKPEEEDKPEEVAGDEEVECTTAPVTTVTATTSQFTSSITHTTKDEESPAPEDIEESIPLETAPEEPEESQEPEVAESEPEKHLISPAQLVEKIDAAVSPVLESLLAKSVGNSLDKNQEIGSKGDEQGDKSPEEVEVVVAESQIESVEQKEEKEPDEPPPEEEHKEPEEDVEGKVEHEKSATLSFNPMITSVVITPSTPPVIPSSAESTKESQDQSQFPMPPTPAEDPKIEQKSKKEEPIGSHKEEKSDESSSSSVLTAIGLKEGPQSPPKESPLKEDDGENAAPTETSVETTSGEEKREKIFYVAKEDEEEEEEDDGENDNNNSGLGSGGLGAIEAGLLNAANAVSAPIVHQLPESIATIPERGLSPDKEPEEGDKPEELAASQEEKAKVEFGASESKVIKEIISESEDPISETLIETAHSAVSGVCESATEALQVAHKTVDEVQQSAQDLLSQRSGQNAESCDTKLENVEDKICDSMKRICHDVNPQDTDEEQEEVAEEPCVKSTAPRPIIPDQFYDGGEDAVEKTVKSVAQSETVKESGGAQEVREEIDDKDVLEGIEDSMIATTESGQDSKEQGKSGMDLEEMHSSTEPSAKPGLSAGDVQMVDLEEQKQVQKKRKKLSDYISTIKEAKAVFVTLLKIAKSGAALSGAVDECKTNAQEAIRRHLEAAEEVYRPVQRDDPMISDSPEPEEQGITVYESLEQMARAGTELFTELVEKVETEIAEEARREQENEPETEAEAERRYSAEVAVNAALQHLHETFKTMQTLGSPKRSSSAAARKMHHLHHHHHCEHHHHHEHHEHHHEHTESGGGAEEEEKSGSSSSAVFSQSLHLSSTLKSPDDPSEGETMRESMASFTSGMGSEMEELVSSTSMQKSSSQIHSEELMSKSEAEFVKSEAEFVKSECEQKGEFISRKISLESSSVQESKTTESKLMSSMSTTTSEVKESSLGSVGQEPTEMTMTTTSVIEKNPSISSSIIRRFSSSMDTADETTSHSHDQQSKLTRRASEVTQGGGSGGQLFELTKGDDSSGEFQRPLSDFGYQTRESGDEGGDSGTYQSGAKEVTSTVITTTSSQMPQFSIPAFPQDILEEEAYSSGDFESDSTQLSKQAETDEEVHNFSSNKDIDNGNITDANTTTTENTNTVTNSDGSVTTETVTTVTKTDNDNSNTNTVTTTRTTRVSTTEEPQIQTGGGGSGGQSAPVDILEQWGKPLGLPVVYSAEGEQGASAGPDSGNFTTGGKNTPKKSSSSGATGKSTPAKKKTSSSHSSRRSSRHSPIYVDLAYVPHHGNSHYCDSEFFRMIRSRYYVFSGLEPSREVFEGLLQGKQQWEDKNLETTIIPTYDTDTLGYWVVDSEKELAEAKIDLAPSASRCTINLQDHETSCAAYRLEF